MRNLTLLVLTIFITASCQEDNNDYNDHDNYYDINPNNPVLVAYYPLDNEALDQSDNKNDGQIFKAVGTTDRHGNENGALVFNGEYSKVICTRQIDDELSEGATFSAWIWYSGTRNGRILSNYNGQGAGYNCEERVGFIFGITYDKRLNMLYAVDNDDYIGRMTLKNAITENEWTHVLGMWNGNFGPEGFRLYINGERVDYHDDVGGRVSCGYHQSINPFYIGMGHCTTGECWPFNGKIDDVRIYSNTLDTTFIKQLANE